LTHVNKRAENPPVEADAGLTVQAEREQVYYAQR
jgi:hypothetical protein